MKATPDLPAFPASEVCLCTVLRRAARSATRLYDERMAESGLKVTQFSLLRNIARAETVNVTDLAERVDLERTAMGRNLDLLERRGLIFTTDATDADQRARVVRLTDEGHRALEKATPIWHRAQAEMRTRLGQGAFASLAAVVAELSPPEP